MNRPHKKASKSLEITKRRACVAELYLKGYTQPMIAEQLGYSVGVIANDISNLKTDWKTLGIVDYDEKKGEELAKIDRVEREAWEAWEKSKGDQETKKRQVHKERVFERPPRQSGRRGEEDDSPQPIGKSKMIVVKELIEELKKSSAGDPRFLDKITWCIETRLRIIGAFKHETAVNNNTVVIQWDELYAKAEGLSSDLLENKIKQLSVIDSKPVETGITTQPKGDLEI